MHERQHHKRSCKITVHCSLRDNDQNFDCLQKLKAKKEYEEQKSDIEDFSRCVTILTVLCMPTKIRVLPIQVMYVTPGSTGRLLGAAVVPTLVVRPHPEKKAETQEKHSGGGG